MTSITLYAGIDYHQKEIQLCLMDEHGKVLKNVSLPNHPQTLDRVARQYQPHKIVAGIEACNGSVNFTQEMQKLGWNIGLAHPGYVSRMKQTPDKSDWTDARVLADLCRVGYLPKVWLPPAEIQVLRELVHLRQGFVKERTSDKLRLRALLRKHRVTVPGTAWSSEWRTYLQESPQLSEDLKWSIQRFFSQIEHLDAEIKLVEKRQREKTKGNAVTAFLQRQPGIGFITAMTLYAEIGDFTRFKNGKQLSNFCGLSPRNASSAGKNKTGGLIGERNRDLRCVLIEAAHRLVRYDEHFYKLHAELRSRGKKYNVAIAAVANRWLRKLFYTVRDFQHSLTNAQLLPVQVSSRELPSGELPMASSRRLISESQVREMPPVTGEKKPRLPVRQHSLKRKSQSK